MPFGGGKTSTLNVSGIAWDADLIVPAARKITVDHIAETTGAHGIVADSSALKWDPPLIIKIWSGSIVTIPAGYILCDGGGGSPNLKDRFVVGAGTTYAVGATGGESTHVLTVDEMAAHTHTVEMSYASGANSIITYCTAMAHGPTATSSSVGANAAHENKPPYYALAWVMKT